MLTLYHGGNEHPIDNTEYYIRELANGLDEVIFDISVWDPIYHILAEEDNIVDRAGQRYLVKQIDAGAVTAKVVCQLDLDEWRATLSVGYDSGSKTVLQQIEAVVPTGWTVQDRSGSSIQRTLHGDFTPLQVCQECTGVYQVYIRWDNKDKICRIYPKAMGDPVGAFATRELNLKEINYKGKSNNFATRLYAYGKDGLSFADINDGRPYVDNNTYSSRVICAYWQDDRYEVKQNLLDDAIEKLALLAVPERSYDCAIVDLQATNPELYNNLDFSLFTAATLIDDVKGVAINYQVVERHVWPYHPDRNDVIFDNSPLKITTEVVQIQDAIENPNSTFQQIWSSRVNAATDWLLSGDGYVVAVKGSDGEWKELLFMDTNDMATAQKVLRINENGIGFSTQGVNGPYENAWTIDGQLNASFITTGDLTANVIKAGVLTDQQGKFSLNMTSGALSMKDGTFSGTIEGSTVKWGDSSHYAKMTYGEVLPGITELLIDSTENMNIEPAALFIKPKNNGSTTVMSGNFAANQQIFYSNGQDYVQFYKSTVVGTPTDYVTFYLGNSNSYALIRNDSKYVIWAGGSDSRLKEDVKDVDTSQIRELFNRIRPISFEYKNDKIKKTNYGLIAEELEQVLEELGMDTDICGVLPGEEQYKYIDYTKMIGLCLAAIKDLYNIIEERR